MKTKLFSLFILIILSSCAKKSVLENTLNCNSTISFSETKVLTDIKKNFKISIPKTWKTELYYDEFQSAIFSADTTKQLTETYIIDTTFKNGELTLDSEFENKIKSENPYTITNAKFEDIHGKPSYWYISKGKKNNFDYNSLNIFIKTNVDTYTHISTEIYGNQNVNNRFCNAIKIINSIEFL